MNKETLIVRYCNKLGQVIDQIVLEEEAASVYLAIQKQYKRADLIKIIDGVEYTLI